MPSNPPYPTHLCDTLELHEVRDIVKTLHLRESVIFTCGPYDRVNLLDGSVSTQNIDDRFDVTNERYAQTGTTAGERTNIVPTENRRLSISCAECTKATMNDVLVRWREKVNLSIVKSQSGSAKSATMSKMTG